jgi:cob(I)alamin adenosyltransferase
MLEIGLVQVYTGTPKKYHYAPIGLSLRAAGHGLRTLITCFVPDAIQDDEIQMISHYLKGHIVVDQTAIELSQGPETLSREKMQSAFRKARQAVMAASYDIVILNGISHALSLMFIGLEDVLRLIEEKPPRVELILTGSQVPEAIAHEADLVTELEVHPISDDHREGEGQGYQGAIEVITGNGKGKTTYCLGRTLLASCSGIRCAFLQFIKSPKPYGEVMAIETLPNVDIQTMGEGFLGVHPHGHKKKHVDAARRAWEKCLREVFSLKYGLIVLDELNTATFHGLVNPARVRELLFLKPKELHLFVSGRNAHAEVMAAASVVIEMKEIKHPYRKGIKARKGIEF